MYSFVFVFSFFYFDFLKVGSLECMYVVDYRFSFVIILLKIFKKATHVTRCYKEWKAVKQSRRKALAYKR